MNYRKDRYGRITLVTEADKEELVRLHEELGLEAEDVLKNSDVLEPKTASPYQKKRLEIGKMSREFTRKAMAPVTEKESQTLEANEKLARENEERTACNKKEAEDRKKGVSVPQA